MTPRIGRRMVVPALDTLPVLVVSKITEYMSLIENNDVQKLALINAGDPTVRRIKPAHDQHMQSLDQVLFELSRRGIAFTHKRIDALPLFRIGGRYRLVIVVGGDGSVLDVGHRAGRLPVVGVNSAADTSHGHFCLAKPDTFAAVLDSIEHGMIAPVNLMRLRAFIDGKVIGRPALNEIFVNNSPAQAYGTPRARYILRIDGVEERHSSDGVFFGTAAGSTAWMRDYYCDIMDITERRIQYLVRGLFVPPEKPLRLVKGFLKEPASMQLTSLMDEGFVAVDGTRNSFPFRRGSVLTVRPSVQDIRLYADPKCNDRYRQVAVSA